MKLKNEWNARLLKYATKFDNKQINYPKSKKHCVKSVQIRSFSGPYSPIFGLNTGKYGPEKTPYLDSFHTERKKSIKGVNTDPGMSVVE